MQALFEHFRKRWPELTKSPLAFLLLAFLSFVAGIIAQSTKDTGHLAEKAGLLATQGDLLVAKEAKIQNYLLALGVNEPNNGTLAALTNQELAAASTILTAKIRQTCLSLDAELGKIEKLQADRKLDDDTASTRLFELLAETSNEFDQTLRSQTLNLDTELRRRLGEEAFAKLPNVPVSMRSADPGSQVNAVGLIAVGSRMSAGYMCLWADGLEQMTNLLPSD